MAKVDIGMDIFICASTTNQLNYQKLNTQSLPKGCQKMAEEVEHVGKVENWKSENKRCRVSLSPERLNKLELQPRQSFSNVKNRYHLSSKSSKFGRAKGEGDFHE